MIMKKVVISIVMLLAFVFLVGCLDYKAYELPEDSGENLEEEASLIDEIAAIERELSGEADTESSEEVPEEGEEVVVEEIVLPELSEEDPNQIFQTITVKENDPVKLVLDVSDPDNDPVKYSFGKPLSDKGEWKTNYGDAGEYIVKITASDGRLTTEKRVKIVVQRKNVPPIISPVRNIVVDEGEEVKFTPEVSDPNKDEVSVTVSDPLKEGVFVTDHTSAGEYNIKVVATDGELETETGFTLTINDVNVLPVISNVKDLEVKEGVTIRIEPRVTDLDEDQITLTISDPVGNDGVWETDYTDHGDYIITITADDGKDKVTERISITIEDVNKAPIIENIQLG